jgi:hypothetical protein
MRKGNMFFEEKFKIFSLAEGGGSGGILLNGLNRRKVNS